MIITCTSCIRFKERYNNQGLLSYTFCDKEVNKASATFSYIWHTTKDTK